MKNEEICPIKAFLSYAKPSIFPNAKNLCNFLAIPESCTRSIITEQCNLEISMMEIGDFNQGFHEKILSLSRSPKRKFFHWPLSRYLNPSCLELFGLSFTFLLGWRKKKEGGAILIFQKRFFFSKMKKFSSKIENFFILDVMLKKGEQREEQRRGLKVGTVRGLVV